MYHLLKGLHEYMTRKDEYSVVIIGLDNAGKTTMLERIKTLYNPIPGMDPEKIGPTVGQNIGKINLPSTTIRFFDLGGQRDIRSIWEKYYDECHAVVFVLDAMDQGRLSEGWEVFDEVLNSPRLLNLPLLLVANKQDSPTSLSVSEIRESFDAWQRASSAGQYVSNAAAAAQAGHLTPPDLSPMTMQEPVMIGDVDAGGDSSAKGKGKGKGRMEDDPGLRTPDAEENKRIWSQAYAEDGGAKAERLASLDVLGASALTGQGVREAVDWLYIRVQNSRRIGRREDF